MERSVGGHAMESSQPCPKGSIRGKMSASEAVYEGCRYNISMLNLAIGRAAVIPKGRNQHKLRALTAAVPVSYTHLRAHETRHDLVCRLLLEKKKNKENKTTKEH